MTTGYVGRFAPSPTGPLHAGSVVAALASWLDARAHGGRWLVRIEDVDGPRCPPGTDRLILAQLEALGLVPDEPPWWQSRRGAAYAVALERLLQAGLAYGCACTRAQIAAAQAATGPGRMRHGELVYPGTCRPDRGGLQGRVARAVRLCSTDPAGRPVWIDWQDRRLGAMRQNLTGTVGDFVLRRADGLWAYQLAVVVDDAEQGITDIVRGEDLADNTPRQRWLQQALGLPAPRCLHTPLVLGADGEKLSKQNGAAAAAVHDPVATLQQACAGLGLSDPALAGAGSRADLLDRAVHAWSLRWGPAAGRPSSAGGPDAGPVPTVA
ncbi:glutamyl-Q tRNA(Asp) synthetase [Sphaerotilus hippei]|uniref:Glutamyl-Q tRNA(Asp) synthetase n=1 Tax=Sphaerotilus hippei TaxID=744406 RepID=A0A318GUZ8_9BURK|nr:tRNA glutamyl-Q(34) synthetase GluQRS [Sphaerotilus hippei]PXW92882.1 glutamyl-Q tRNA(Asp) synthetase [Sphaerotilus hippei]